MNSLAEFFRCKKYVLKKKRKREANISNSNNFEHVNVMKVLLKNLAEPSSAIDIN
jgi:hypothetical protein